MWGDRLLFLRRGRRGSSSRLGRSATGWGRRRRCLGGRFALLDELHRVPDVLRAILRTLDRIGKRRIAARLADEIIVLPSRLLEHRHCVAALGLVLLREDRLVVVGFGPLTVDLLGFGELLFGLGNGLLVVGVADLTAD